jgi:hypothetical protein
VGNGSVVPHILNLGLYAWAENVCYTLSMRLGELQSLSTHFGDAKNPLHMPSI